MKRILIPLLFAAAAFPLAAQEALITAVERLQKEYPQDATWTVAVQATSTGVSRSTVVNFSSQNAAGLRRSALDSIVATFEQELPRATESIRYANKTKADTLSFILNYDAQSLDRNSSATVLGNIVLGSQKNRAVALLQRGEQTVWVAVKSTVQIADTMHQGIDYAPIEKLIASELVAKGATCRPANYQCEGYEATNAFLHNHYQSHMNGQHPTTGLLYVLPPSPGNLALFEKFRYAAREVLARSRRHSYSHFEKAGHMDFCDEWKRAVVVHIQPDGSLAVLRAEEPAGQLYIPFFQNKLFATYRNGHFGD